MLKRSNLHPYQEEMVCKAKTMPHLGLFMEPGLGKTTTALTIIAESPRGSTLIVAPKKVAESVWAQECQKWEHLRHMTAVKVMGTPAQRLNALKSKSDIYIVNLENLVWLLDSNQRQFDYLIVDESSRMKDPSTKRFKALKKHLRQFTRRIILTGTPTPQSLQDIWSQVGILDLGSRLESSISKFRSKYLDPDQRNRHTGVVYNWKLKPGADKQILEKVSDICFSLKAEDYLTLPERTNLYQKVILDPQTISHYEKLKKDMVLDMSDGTITAVSAAALANKLLQATSGALYDEQGEWHSLHESKLEYLESILEEQNAPTLLFYNFKFSLERIRARFPHAQVLSDSNIEAWRQGKIPLLLAHPKSGGIGINLQCNTAAIAQMVWFDLPWSAEDYIQANARIHRQGQEKPVIIHHLVAENTIDEKVVMVLEGKITTQDAVLEELKL